MKSKITSSAATLWCIIGICLMLSSCGGTEHPDLPSREKPGQKEFIITKSEILSATVGYITDSYQVSLTSAQGDYLSFVLHTQCLKEPIGKFVTSAEGVSGTLSDLHYTQSASITDSPQNLTLTLTPSEIGTAILGTLTTTKGNTVNISGILDAIFPKFSRTLIFPTLSADQINPENLVLNFATSQPETGEGYSLEVKLHDLASGTFPLALNPATLTGRYLIAGNTIAESQIQIHSGEMEVSVIGNILIGHFEYENFDITFTCELPKHDDPEPEYCDLTELLEVRQSGSNFVSIKMATEGVEMQRDPITWQTSYSGTGQFIDLEIYAPDTTLQPGQYSVASSPDPYTFRAGWNPGDIYGIGIDFENWGTCLYSLSSNGMTVRHIKDGIVYVQKESDVYTITLVSSLIAARYIGAIPWSK